MGEGGKIGRCPQVNIFFWDCILINVWLQCAKAVQCCMQELVQQVRSWWRSEREELELQLCRSSSSSFASSSSSSSSPRPRPTPTAASARKQRPNNRGRGFFSYCSTTPLPRHSQQRNDLGLPTTYLPT